ncbi:MAG: hypothetical protein Q7S22_07685 [Candidatus Micrarchaeota archaeon]|nr:hypothetical protein [Candidatus Micrarchaeota archaeon]
MVLMEADVIRGRRAIVRPTKALRVVVPLVEPPVRAKLTLADAISRLGPRAFRQKALSERLLQERPLTRFNASEFFLSECESDTLQYKINQWARREYCCDAIIKRSLDGSSSQGYRGFWVMDLNPQLFEVPKRAKLEPGKDFSLEDVFGTRELVFIRYLAKNPCSSISKIREVFRTSGKFDMISYLNQQAKIFHVQGLIRRTPAKPFLYWLDSKIAVKFGLSPVDRNLRLEELFNLRELSVVLQVLKFGKIPVSELCSALGIDAKVLWDSRGKMEKICKVLKIPKPFVAEGDGIMLRYSINPNFAKYFAIKMETMPRVDEYFTPIMVKLIMAIAENPLSNFAEIAIKLELSLDAVYDRLTMINAVCAKHGFEKPIKVPVASGLLVLPLEFLKRFNLPIVVPDKKKLVRGEIAEAVYAEMVRDTTQTPTQIAKRLSLKVHNVNNSKTSIKRKMTKFSDLLATYIQATTDPKQLKDQIVSYRLEHGRWPTDADLNNGAMNISLALGTGCTPKRILSFVESNITFEDRVSIAQAGFGVVQTWDFSKFKDPELVLRAFAGALIRGAELPQLENILEVSDTDEITMEKANKLDTKFGIKAEELAQGNWRTASNSYVSN